MRKLHEMATDIRNRLRPVFPVVRFSTAASPAQMLNELKAIGAGKLPAIAAVIDQGKLTDSNCVRDDRVTLLLIDRFHAGSDDKALSAWKSLEDLFRLFPADAMELEGVEYLPVRFYAVQADPGFACFAYELVARQGIL